jgi:hypothetical protein
MNDQRHVPLIIFATVAFGSDRSSSDGPAPECPSRSDISSTKQRRDAAKKRVCWRYVSGLYVVIPFLPFSKSEFASSYHNQDVVRASTNS